MHPFSPIISRYVYCEPVARFLVSNGERNCSAICIAIDIRVFRLSRLSVVIEVERCVRIGVHVSGSHSNFSFRFVAKFQQLIVYFQVMCQGSLNIDSS